MKKVVLTVLVVLSVFILFGCSKKDNLQDNFSEITYFYFNGISNDKQMSASISVGEREDPYIIDGIHGNVCDFSLIVVRFNFPINENSITIDFYSEKDKKSIVLEYNPLNSTYMADLGYAIKEGKNYSMKYKNNTIDFIEESKSFKIGFSDAILKSIEVLNDKLNVFYKGNDFKGECYLKIYNNINEDFQKLYWIFTIVGEDETSHNVLIDIDEEKIILSN